MILIMTIVILSVCWASPVFAGTYWVHSSGAASWANCQRAIDPESNYCSLATANSNARAGDTVYIKAGTYNIAAGGRGIAPAQSGTGIGTGRIIFSKAPGEEKPKITGSVVGIALDNRSYIKVDGIVVQGISGGYSVSIQNSAHHNEVTNCELYTKIVEIRGMCTNSTFVCPVTHNWFHHNTLYDMQPGNLCTEGGDAIRLGQPWAGSQADNYNTIEDNTIIHSGHGNLDSYGFQYSVIKNNISRSEPWWTANGITYQCPGGLPNYTNDAYDNKWGHRNFQIGFMADGRKSYSLVEGNRLGYQSANPGNAGDANLSIAGGGFIVRYNFAFGAMKMGMYFKYVHAFDNGYGGRDNRVYNNTIYRSGWGYEGGGAAASNRYGFGMASYGPYYTGNELKNNIIYNSRDGDTGTCGGGGVLYANGTVKHPGCAPLCDFRTANVFDHNWGSSPGTGFTGSGDPLFVNPDVTSPASIATLPNLTLQSNSPARDGGVHLTTTVGSGSRSTTLVVADAQYFQDGSWGSDLARGITHFPDWIAIGSVNNVVQISSINYDANTITLASPMTWSHGASIWLYKKSDGTLVLYGSAPDFGAAEYSSSGQLAAPANVRILY